MDGLDEFGRIIGLMKKGRIRPLVMGEYGRIRPASLKNLMLLTRVYFGISWYTNNAVI